MAWGAAAAYNATRALPAGMRLDSAPQPVQTRSLSFLHDLTGADAYGHGFSSHGIFDTMLRTIGAARSLVVLDCHLCSDLQRSSADAVAGLTPMGAQLVDALLARKAAVPQLQVLVIADPVNGLAGSAPPAGFARLRAAGAQVVIADLSVLRDRNVLYALPWAQLANLKSCDRRVLIADDGQGMLTALVGTAEPAMASSIHTVTALQVGGPAVQPLLLSELDLARAFGWRGSISAPAGPPAGPDSPADADAVDFQWLGAGAIRDALLEHIAATKSGDSIDIASDSLSERATIAALLGASRRGVAVRMILDPQKSDSLWGGANQSVGSELIAASDGRIRVAWYRTHSEQFRAALVLINGHGTTWMLTGSASLTRRDLGDYDPTLDAALAGPPGAAPLAGAQEFFDTLWNDRGPPGIEYTADADTWADPSQLRYWAYRVMELLGISRT
ncbi:MAG TPA: phospholipase D-like domain-containing protein [Steroidobacteraceae bacterium]|nr:phospholipase D-like domain-containing protein [Steroidobacteraceae bacterium]